MEWDYIVIGAGSAGCAVVHHLVATGKRVLLIEAGGEDRKATIRLPFMMLHALDRFDWGYRCDPDHSRRGCLERWQRGKVLGGTSSVNGMIYVRGSHADYDLWATESDDSWSSASVMALFREMECCDPRSIASSVEQRGFAGPLHVRMVRRPHRTTKAFVEAMARHGHPFNADYNAETQEGVGYTQLTQHRGLRFSAFDAFVRPHLRESNLHILSNCLVRDIIIEDGRATGVTVEHGGEPRRIAGRRVILSAGSINSPKILMLSGIGDGASLSRLGIDVKGDCPAVGQGLMDHPLVRITYDMRVPTYAISRNPIHSLSLAVKYLLGGQGLLASPHEAMAFVRSTPGLAEPDLQFHIAPIGVAIDSATNAPALMKTPSIFVSIKKNRPASRGAVRLRSADPHVAPTIDANLLGDPADTLAITRGIGILRKVMEAPPMRALVAREHALSAACGNEEELLEFVTRNATIACHSVGTCRMGKEPGSVTDPGLRVRGIANLWIADASIMPFNISGNTNAASLMIGYKLGREMAGT